MKRFDKKEKLEKPRPPKRCPVCDGKGFLGTELHKNKDNKCNVCNGVGSY